MLNNFVLVSRPGLATAVAALGVGALLTASRAAPVDADMFTAFPHPKGYVCYRAEKPPVIDGVPDDAVWESAPWTDTFVDIEGDKRQKPRLKTRVKMLWDEKALYITADLEEPHVWGTLTDHDAVIFHDNDFEVFLDPDGDNHLYGELELNVLNTTWDLLLTKPYKDGGKAVNAWEITGLKTAVKVRGTPNNPRDKDVGWTLEIAWPWEGLKELRDKSVPPNDGDQWRINFSRVEWDIEIADGKYQKVKGRPEHNWVWSPQGVIDMHRPERWGYLQFSSAKSGTTEFRPDPNWVGCDTLHRIYYAQRNHHKKHGRYTSSLEELGLKLSADGLSLAATRSTFEASWLGGKTGKPQMTILQDSRLIRE